jgi:hypothetical protein
MSVTTVHMPGNTHRSLLICALSVLCVGLAGVAGGDVGNLREMFVWCRVSEQPRWLERMPQLSLSTVCVYTPMSVNKGRSVVRCRK